MLDTTSYAEKLPPSLNQVLKTFTGGECLMVRKIKIKDSIKNKVRNCHLNVKSYIEKYGGRSVSGWLLFRYTKHSDNGMYVWSFHSVWDNNDGKWLDVTEDTNYIGRDKSIFVPDSTRLPNLNEGLSYNSFMVFTETRFAQHYGISIGKQLLLNKPYWCDNQMLNLLGGDEHSGVYRLLSPAYPNNYEKMCEEYKIEIIEGKIKPLKGSKYDISGSLPIQIVFDYSLNARS